MGRAGRVAPRTCSTLELRTHTSSVTVSVSAKTPPLVHSPSSLGTPVEHLAPATVRPALQEWPHDALQVVHRQMEALRSHSHPTTTTGKREIYCNDATPADGFEVALLTQAALPEDWEQILNLKTGQFYYIHWNSCKRAKQDPRELVRQADETVAAYLLEAHIRGSESESSSSSKAECSLPPPDVCERTSSFYSVAAVRELGNERVGCSFKEAENVEEKGQTVMVVSGCHGCSTFVLLSLSSPTCPSCGHSDVRGGIR